MSIGREESLFLTVSEDHRKRTYPEYVQKMSEPFERAGGMVEVYEGVVLGGADKFFGLDDLNLWLRRHRYAAYDMNVLLPIAHLCVERAARAKLMGERPGVAVMAEQAAGGVWYRTGKIQAAVAPYIGQERGILPAQLARLDVHLRSDEAVSRRGDGGRPPHFEKFQRF